MAGLPGAFAQYQTKDYIDGLTFAVTTNNEAVILDADPSLTEIVIPQTVTYGGVTYPVVQIGWENEYPSFSNCKDLVSVTLPPSIKKICSGAFYQCKKLKNINLENVEEIQDHVFMECESLEEVNLSKIRELGYQAFIDCTSLKKVNIPKNSGLYKIEDFTFFRCSSLESIELPENVLEIGSFAFARCSALKSVTFNNHYCDIMGSTTFQGCTALEAVNLNLNEYYTPAVAYWLLYKFGGKESNPLMYARHLYLNGVECTEVNSKDWKDVINYSDIMELRKITDYAFINCEGLKTVTLGDKITEVGESTFSGCTNLESVTLGESIKTLGQNAFSGCTSLKSLVLSETLASIPVGAFSGCSALTTLDIPSTVEEIGWGAFSYCTAVNTVEVYAPEPPVCGGTGNTSPFVGVTATLHVLKGAKEAYMAAEVWQDFAEIIDDLEPKKEEYIELPVGYILDNLNGTATVYGSTYDIVSAEIPAKVTYNDREYIVTTIGYGAFNRRDNLVSVSLPEGLTTVEDWAFGYSNNIAEINIPSTVTSIGEASFAYIYKVESLTIPGSIKYISRAAFDWPLALKELIIEPGVVEIGEIAFRSAIVLPNLTIPEGVEKIGWWAFGGAIALKTLSLPSTLTSIDSGGFAGCDALENVYCAAVEPPVCVDNPELRVFTTTTATLHVPMGTKEKYKSADVWKEFANIVEDVSSVDTVATDSDNGVVTVYNLQGVRLGVNDRAGLKALPRGLYIINGKKTYLSN